MPQVTDAHGVQLFYGLTEPEGEPRGIVHVLHGVGEHGGRYRALTAALALQGWIAVADDHRGHGRTGMEQHHDPRRLGRLGRGGHRAALDGVRLVVDTVRSEHPALPVVLIGHSWGSFLAQMLLNERPGDYAGIILIGSALRWPGSLNSGDLNRPWKAPGATGMEWLSSDPAVVAEFLADPLTTTTPLLKLFGPWGAVQLLGRPSSHIAERAGQVPVLLQVGREDTVGGPVSVHRLAQGYRERSGLTDVRTIVYDGRHEILNEAVGPAVMADILAWLDRQMPRDANPESTRAGGPRA